MVKLLIETPEGSSEFEFKSSEVVLGRDVSCAIQVLDPLSSRKHCRIFLEGDRYFVEDMNSSNGTKVNGEAIKKKELQEKDCIQIGQVKITFQRPLVKVVPKVESSVVSSVSSAAIGAASVIRVKSKDKVKEYFFEKSEITIGREDTNDVVINEKLASRKHVRFLAEGKQFFIEDLNGANGTRVKDVKIKGRVPYALGSSVWVGSTEIIWNKRDFLDHPILCMSHKDDKKELVLDGEKVFGRDATCHYVLLDHNASRRHFKIYIRDHTAYVEDLKSSNGTKVNGVKITEPTPLYYGDVVSVGDTYVKLKELNHDTQITAQVPGDRWTVRVTLDLETREYSLYDGMEVGRGEDCAILIKEVKASRKQFKFLIEESKVFIEDLGSSNGTKVDGIVVIKSEIHERSVIEVGHTKIQIVRGLPDPNLGKQIKTYRVLKCLGVGDNGGVYVAQQTSMKRIVSLKFIAERFLETEIKKRNFTHDMAELAKIQHPNLLSILELFSFRVIDKDVYILVTEYVEGLALSKRIQKSGKIEFGNAVSFIEQACDALEVLHVKNLYHKNLKPSVFLITKDGQLKLADAGFSKPELRSEYELSTEAIWYEAPERTKGQPATAASDIYELGATLYHAVTGKVPFDGKTALAVNTKKINILPEEPSKLNPEIPSGLNRIIMKCLQLEPTARYSNVMELKSDLLALKITPVEWDLGDDYKQFERIKRQDFQSILWTIVGVLAILGIAFNWFAINNKTELRKIYQGYHRLEDVAQNKSADYEFRIKELQNILEEDFPQIVKDKAQDFLDKLKISENDNTPPEQIREYQKALALIDQGGAHVKEGWEILKVLSQQVNGVSAFGKKVIQKERAVKALLGNQ